MIIGLSGYARSGKDTVAEYLVEEHGFTRVAFADPMRNALYRLNPMISIHDMTHVPLASAVDGMGWEEVKSASADLRGLLQRMGTEVGRDMFGDDFWVNQAWKEAEWHEDVVFSDVRYTNEANSIRNRGGVVWRISRPNVAAANSHGSESALDGYFFNEDLDNSGSLDDLYMRLDDLVANIREGEMK